MKRATAILTCIFLLSSTYIAAASTSADTPKIPSQLIQALQDITIDFAGSKIFVPKGQTIISGQRDNGAIVIRGRNLNNIKLGNALISTQGNTVLSFYPSSEIAFLHSGEALTVTDSQGRSYPVGSEGAVSTQNVTINSETVAKLKEQAKAEAAQVAQELGEAEKLPDFVASTQTSAVASEQATQNVEETEGTLSSSTPR